MEDTYSCKICGDSFDDFYDCKSHVYTKHGEQEEHCGIPETCPEHFVSGYYERVK